MARIFGSATRGDGSKVNGTATVSTSWNSNQAVPRNGEYSLELGSDPKGRITVYVDGMIYRADFMVKGDTHLDIRLR